MSQPVQHTVSFSLRHAAGSAEEADFLTAARVLATIPGVERFEQLRQVGRHSDLRFSFSMHFADAATYAAYDAHPLHQGFVRDRWQHEVTSFTELDFVALDPTS